MLKYFYLQCRGRDDPYEPPPSRPGEFHPEPLTEPCVNLSIYTARAIHKELPPSATTIRFLLLPVDQHDPDANGLSPSLHGRYPLHRCRVGGGALARWPPSAAQSVRAVFPHTAFTKTRSSGMQSKESTESNSPARTLRTTWFPATVSSRRSANA